MCTAGAKPYLAGDDEYDGEDEEDASRGDNEVSLSRISIQITPLETWQWLLDDSWRQFRAQFYDAKVLERVNWDAKRGQYAALLPRVGNRDEFDVLLHEMLTEGRSSHVDEWDPLEDSIPREHLYVV